MEPKQIVDPNKRIINYLRLSITDRCNLRCSYCVGGQDFQYVPHNEILSYEEIMRLARLFIGLGIRKIRVTGGEPLVRKGVLHFLSQLSRIPDLDELTLTTNGVLLEEFAADLKKNGINRLNVSLDSLKPEKFERITGRNYFHKVWDGIQIAQKMGFHPLKINVVAMRGINDDEILDFARLAVETPYHVRFIEYMPVGKATSWSQSKFLSTGEIQRIIQEAIPLEVISSGPTEGPAQRFKPGNGNGEVGFIGALTHHFCSTCNRLRLTATGKLRTCLLSDKEYDLKMPLRRHENEAVLTDIIEDAVKHKASRHSFEVDDIHPSGRLMVGIGG